MPDIDPSLPVHTVPLPTSKKEVLSRVLALLGTEHIIPQQCVVAAVAPPKIVRLGGTGAPGRYLELLVGSQGKNKAIADAVGIEIKFHSGGSLLTLFHNEVCGGSRALWPLIKKFGRLDDEERWVFRHTVSDTSYLRAIRARGRITIRPATGEGPEVYWDEDKLQRAATIKINHVILVEGRVSIEEGQRVVRYDSAKQYIDLRCGDFLSSFGNRFILIDFDVHQKRCGSLALRNHGTKLRTKVQNMSELWEKKLKWDGTMWVPST